MKAIIPLWRVCNFQNQEGIVNCSCRHCCIFSYSSSGFIHDSKDMQLQIVRKHSSSIEITSSRLLSCGRERDTFLMSVRIVSSCIRHFLILFLSFSLSLLVLSISFIFSIVLLSLVVENQLLLSREYNKKICEIVLWIVLSRKSR